MQFVYLDEFGHIGPFIHRSDKQYKDSPVFGVAGLALPETNVRQFSAAFLQLKSYVLSADIERSGKRHYQWEKKGSELFRPRTVTQYPAVRNAGFRLINLIDTHGGKILYHGREKQVSKMDGNPTGLYKTVLSKTIRQIDHFCEQRNSNFVLVLDQHDARKELLECAAKTMYGIDPARRLLSPPFEVESHLNQPIQAADWIAAIVGRLWAFELQPQQYTDHERVRAYYWDRIHQVSSHSSVVRRPRINQRSSQNPHLLVETALSRAFHQSGLAALLGRKHPYDPQ